MKKNDFKAFFSFLALAFLLGACGKKSGSDKAHSDHFMAQLNSYNQITCHDYNSERTFPARNCTQREIQISRNVIYYSGCAAFSRRTGLQIGYCDYGTTGDSLSQENFQSPQELQSQRNPQYPRTNYFDDYAPLYRDQSIDPRYYYEDIYWDSLRNNAY